MSTYIYLTCLDHDPPLQAEDESGQHLYDLPRIRQELRNRAAWAAAYEQNRLRRYSETGAVDDYFTANSARFLAQHKTCRIGIRDEYGAVHAVLAGDDQ